MPGPGNRPLQARSGYNQGQQSLPLSDAKFLGQPAIKLGNGDTVIYRAASVSPGENNIRTKGTTPFGIAGIIFNRSGGPVGADLIYVDPNGNEFPANPGLPVLPIPDGGQQVITASPNFSGIWPFLEGWTVKIRITSGDPSGGQGVIAWAWAHDRTRNFKAFIEELTTTQLEIGPAEGRAWQLCSSVYHAVYGQDGNDIYYLNFDSVDRTVVDEILHLADEDIRINSAPIVVTPRVDIDSGIESAYQDEDLLKEKGLIIAYPDTLKFKAGENQTSAPLYLVATFAEFDLPKDLG